MEYIFNKPKVFLSHSKKDIDFIKRIENDLRLCNIETWLDEVEIPHGKSWQDSIFEYGIPTCDSIIAYLTENSIESPVVKKEIDVALLQNFRDNNIAFLPYVNRNELRSILRPDIQSLQTKEWNDSNYLSFLPSVVANIWQNYLKKTISNAILIERYKISQLELELERRKKQDIGIFSQNEITEFEYLYKAFNVGTRIEVEAFLPNIENSYNNKPDKTYVIEINTLSIIVKISEINELNSYYIFSLVENACKTELDSLNPNVKDHPCRYNIVGDYDIVGDFGLIKKLLLYGLLERITQSIGNGNNSGICSFFDVTHINATNKMHRFIFWLTYNNRLPDKISISFIASK